MTDAPMQASSVIVLSVTVQAVYMAALIVYCASIT